MAPMRCPTCHRELEPGTTTCPNCSGVDTEPTVVYVPGADHLADDDAHVGGVHGYALVVERGPRTGMTFVLKEGVTTVGRHPESDIFLNDVTVSRHHCRFITDGPALRVEDSGSTNGIYVDGERVDEAVLSAGDRVFIGKFHLVVAIGDD